MAATRSVRRIAAWVSASSKLAKKASAPRRRASEKTANRGSTRNSTRKPTARAISVQRTRRPSPKTPSGMTEPPPAESLDRGDGQEGCEGDDQHYRGDGRRAGIVELLEPGDDQQRRDLRHERHVAGDEDHRAVLADGAGEGERAAGQQRRHERRQHDAEHGLAA